MTTVDLLDRIDELTAPTGRCRVCDVELARDAPSEDFCGELHQQLWSQRRATRDGRALTEAEVLELLRQRGEQPQALADAMRPAVEQMVREFQKVARAFTQFGRAVRDAGVLPDVAATTPTIDPKTRALELRRHRNTGPPVHADPRRNRRG